MAQWAYEMDNRTLLKEFWMACARAGVSGSGLVIDVAGPSNAEEARYLKGVLLARLEGKKPPFKRGDVVNPVGGGQPRTIERIHYNGGDQWSLEFEGISLDRWSRPDANQFVTMAN